MAVGPAELLYAHPSEFEIHQSSMRTVEAESDIRNFAAASAAKLKTSFRRIDRTDSPGHLPARNFDIGS